MNIFTQYTFRLCEGMGSRTPTDASTEFFAHLFGNIIYFVAKVNPLITTLDTFKKLKIV